MEEWYRVEHKKAANNEQPPTNASREQWPTADRSKLWSRTMPVIHSLVTETPFPSLNQPFKNAKLMF